LIHHLPRLKMQRKLAAGACIVLVCASASPASAQTAPPADYSMFNLDPMRSGINTAEHILSPTTVSGLRRVWSTQLNGVADESLIELAHVGGPNAPSLLYTTTRRGVTYALNAADGKVVWTFDPRDDQLPGYRITTATPVADPSRAWIYTASPDGHIHKLSSTTGKEAAGWPVAATLHPQDEKLASAFNFVAGNVVEITSGYIGDAGRYDGHVIAVNAQTRKVAVFNSLCSDYHGLFAETSAGGKTCSYVQSGMWARSGAVVDLMNGSPSKGSMFAVTGNGDYNHSTNWGDTVLRLNLGNGGFVLKDTYTPTDFAHLDSYDLDLGSTAPILLPRQSGAHPWLAVQGGKDGYLRVLDRTDMSGRGGFGHTGGEVGQFLIPQGGHMPTTGISWKDGSGVAWIFYSTDNGIGGIQVRIVNGKATLHQAWLHGGTYSSPLMANGVLYAAENGALRAFNPQTGVQYWSSDQSTAGQNIRGVHWESPTVINGHVYMPDENGVVTAYGIS
jgi:outer membrane protein assembly factor BamB